MEGVLDVQRDHVGMIRRSLKLLRPGGRLVFSTNYTRFKLDAEALRDLSVRGHQRAHDTQGLRAQSAHSPLLRDPLRMIGPAQSAIVRFLARRALLSLATLAILSIVVFLGGQLLPGDVGRAVLGPLADARAVAVFNHQVGVDRPLLVQYWDWISHFLAGDMGTSFTFRSPVAPFIGAALVNSLKLAGLAFVLVVPLGIAGGVWAALRVGRLGDRGMVLLGQSLGVVPEFISSIVLILIFGVWLRWLPMSADWPEGAGAAHAIALSDLAVAAARARLLRLRRARGARRHHRGARCGLHADRDSQRAVDGGR